MDRRRRRSRDAVVDGALDDFLATAKRTSIL